MYTGTCATQAELLQKTAPGHCDALRSPRRKRAQARKPFYKGKENRLNHSVVRRTFIKTITSPGLIEVAFGERRSRVAMR